MAPLSSLVESSGIQGNAEETEEKCDCTNNRGLSLFEPDYRESKRNQDSKSSNSVDEGA